ncbi:MAG: hypothetical protein HYT28_02290 [Parcubacteria group bacterium]|nr:hypothetical protein [Parcubacteria group bacterium]
MYYHQHNNNRFPGVFARKWIVAIAVLALLFFAGQSVSRTIASFAYPVTYPLLRFGASVTGTLNNLFPFFKTNKTLIRENDALKKALGEVNGTLLTHTLLIEENKALKESFGRKDATPRILANILAKPNRSPYDTLILDAGTEEHINLGDIVSVFETAAIGEITEVYPHASKAALFSSPEKKTAVTLESAHITAEIIGRGGGAFLFTVPRDIAVSRGEMLILPGTRHLVAGSVTSVEILPDAPFQTVTAVLPVNIFEITRVFITPGNGLRVLPKTAEEITNN